MSRRGWFVLLVCVLCGGLPAGAEEGRPTEYEVKAAFLYNFARFVTWPDAAPQDTLRICVIGDDPFGEAFDKVLGRGATPPIRVRRQAQLEAPPQDCHILFLGRGTTRQTREAVAAARDRPILTVSDTEDFAVSGGIIGFVIRQKKVRFQINPGAAEAAGIVLSAKLLRLAEIVGEKDR